MENNNEQGRFSYTYSAREQEELRRLREKYTHTHMEENKMDRLRRLDASVTKKAQTISLIFGVLGALVLGFGMSMCMTDLGDMLGLHKNVAMVLGIVVGVVGGVFASVAYPMYNVILKWERKKKAPEILRLTEELMK